MRINKLTASFGKLENQTLCFHDGLNVIAAPNESGKSTWCAFISAMLYGIDSSQRAKAGYIPDKQRYAPWSGAPMEGTMDITAGGRDITLTRTTRSKNAPMRDFSAVYTGSNVAVDGLTGLNAGETLTGVSREVFRRSAFVPQGALTVSGNAELEKRITDIVSTGEEQTSYSEADEQLRAWQRKRRYNRKGMLPELEYRMDDAKRKLDDMSGFVDDIGEYERRLEAKRQECRELEAAVNESRRRRRKEAMDQFNAGKAEEQRCGDAHDRALEALDDAKDALRSSQFGSADEESVKERTDADLKTLEELKEKANNKPKPLLAILAFVLSAVCAAMITILDSVVFMVLAGVFCVAAIILLFRYIKSKRTVESAAEERSQLLLSYNARGSKDISEAVREHSELWAKVREAENNEIAAAAAYEKAKAAQERISVSTIQELDFSSGDSEAAVLSRKLTNARAQAEELSRYIAGKAGRLAAMGDPVVLSSELGCMAELHEVMSEEYDALTMAVDALREADSEIQGRFSPELGRVAAGYMSLITGGKYSDVMINRDFSAMTKAASDAVARPAEYLSAGTLDLMYLAVRLAVCELALPEGEKIPLIIDDALVNLDDERTAQAMELLRNIAETRQVILFTCRNI